MAKTSEWIGRELNGYTIVELIGSGSMADVFLARQPSMNRWVAIKILSSALTSDNQFVARFRQESQIVAALEHPHILPVIDYGELDDTPYLVMRYISGGTLQDLLQNGPLSPNDIVRYLTEVGRGLDYAHSLGVVHRDVKPKNILLDTRGNSFITDFGLAKIIRGGGLTHSGVGMIGTPHYMSPEQGRGQAVDGRSDLYSLGVMLYEMLTGRVPFDADSAVGIVMRHINDPVPPVTQANGGLPLDFDGVIRRALAKAPDERFQTAQEMTEAVAGAFGTSVITGPVLTRPLPQTQRIGEARWPERMTRALSTVPETFRQQRWPILVASGGLLLLVATLALWGMGILPTSLPPSTARVTPPGASPAVITSPAPPSATPAPTGTLPADTPVAIPTRTPGSRIASPTASAEPPTGTLPAVEVVLAPKDGMLLVHFPAGSFLLGSPDTDLAAKEDEKPQFEVLLDSFWIDKTEVTVAQFEDFIRETGYVTDAESGTNDGRNGAKKGGIVFSGDDALFVLNASWLLPEGPGAQGAQERPRSPVVQVSWNDARAYCEWAGRRLPTEAEWDRSAHYIDGRLYPWGATFDGTQTNFCDSNCAASWRNTAANDGATRTNNVGAYPNGASREGVLDLSGNVWEWVADYYDFRGYYRFPTVNPLGAETGTERVVRGGSWIDTVDRVRAAARNKFTPESRNNFTGFRCATTQP